MLFVYLNGTLTPTRIHIYAHIHTHTYTHTHIHSPLIILCHFNDFVTELVSYFSVNIFILLVIVFHVPLFCLRFSWRYCRLYSCISSTFSWRYCRLYSSFSLYSLGDIAVDILLTGKLDKAMTEFLRQDAKAVAAARGAH